MALPTAEDNLHAMMYALDRIKRERCAIASRKPNSGVKYEPNDGHRIYPCHSGLQDCEHGNCRIATKAKCDSISQLPFDATSGETIESVPCATNSDCLNNFTCDQKLKTCIPKNPYLEFRNECLYAHTIAEVKKNATKCIYGSKCNAVVQKNGIYSNSGPRKCIRLHGNETADNFIKRMQ